MLFAYFGPETFLPLTSIVAGVLGVALMFGKNAFRLLLIPFKKLAKPSAQNQQQFPGGHTTPPAPHFGQPASALAKRRASAAASRTASNEQEPRD